MAPARIDAALRFWPKVDQTGECWIWTAAISSSGYGRFRPGGSARHIPAHRFAYELLVGPIPDDLYPDHLCRVRRCVNPAHIELVSFRENVMRGNGAVALIARGEMENPSITRQRRKGD